MSKKQDGVRTFYIKKENNHTSTDLRSALRHTVRATCKAALLFPPDCDTQSIHISATVVRMSTC